jgi:hypothetical protein
VFPLYYKGILLIVKGITGLINEKALTVVLATNNGKQVRMDGWDFYVKFGLIMMIFLSGTFKSGF